MVAADASRCPPRPSSTSPTSASSRRSTGWVVSVDAIVYKTTDGGKTWLARLDRPRLDAEGLDFADAGQRVGGGVGRRDPALDGRRSDCGPSRRQVRRKRSTTSSPCRPRSPGSSVTQARSCRRWTAAPRGRRRRPAPQRICAPCSFSTRSRAGRQATVTPCCAPSTVASPGPPTRRATSTTPTRTSSSRARCTATSRAATTTAGPMAAWCWRRRMAATRGLPSSSRVSATSTPSRRPPGVRSLRGRRALST